jgi:hypothetical protein
MASIALSVVGCIDYLAYGAIFTSVMFLPKNKGDVFFSAKKAALERWLGAPSSEAYLVLFGGKKKSQNKNFDDHITTI